MKKPHPLTLLFLLTLLALSAGCHSARTAQHRYRDTPRTYADHAARCAYIDTRTKELTDKGVSKDDAAARASREWFASAPIANESPTYSELKRREAQADFEADLAKQKKDASPY